MVTPLSRLSNKQLQSFEQLLQSGESEMSAAEIDQLATAMGLPSQNASDGVALSADEYGDKLAAEASLHEFTEQAWEIVEPETEFKDGWHIRAICDHLEALLFGEFRNLLINVPPGAMKSLCTSVFLPAWAWTVNPSIRFLFASYDQGLSTRDSLRCRQIITSRWYRDRWGDRFKITTDQNEKTRFDNDQRGWRIATSIGGRGTGEHPDVVICDDPHNVKRSESEKDRETVHGWWDGTISSRGKVRNVRRCVIMQRLHQDDLSGHILRADAGRGRWEHICLPMRYEPDRMGTTKLGWTDPRTEDGELLWPEVYDEQKVGELEDEMGSLRAAGQLQQRPVPLGGQMFKREWFEIVPAAPAKSYRLRYWDKAGTEDGGKYTSGVKLAMDSEGVVYIEDVKRDQLSPFGRNRLIKNVSIVDRRRHGPTYEVWVEQEPGSGGKFDAMYTVRQLAGISCYTDKVTGSKETRAHPLASYAEAGNVKLVEGDWNEAFLDEISIFPKGKFSDQVDGAAGGFDKLTGGGEYDDDEDLIASGEDPQGERAPLQDHELEDLPDYLRDLVEHSRESKQERDDWEDEDEDW